LNKKLSRRVGQTEKDVGMGMKESRTLQLGFHARDLVKFWNLCNIGAKTKKKLFMGLYIPVLVKLQDGKT
jgi:hypothetical protein